MSHKKEELTLMRYIKGIRLVQRVVDRLLRLMQRHFDLPVDWPDEANSGTAFHWTIEQRVLENIAALAKQHNLQSGGVSAATMHSHLRLRAQAAELGARVGHLEQLIGGIKRLLFQIDVRCWEQSTRLYDAAWNLYRSNRLNPVEQAALRKALRPIVEYLGGERLEQLNNDERPMPGRPRGSILH